MANWESLRRYIKSAYEVSDDDLDSLALVFDAGLGRSQVVSVLKIEHLDREWATVWTTVCTESELQARDALRRNAGLPGSLALLDDGAIIFKHSFPLHDVDPSEIETALKLVVEYGDLLEEEFTGKDSY